MPHTFRPTLPLSILLLAIGGCQLIGGLDELRLGAASSGGNGGGGGAGGSGGGEISSSSSSSGSVGGAGGGPTVTAVWSKSFGDSLPQLVTDVAVDAMGNIFVVGSFQGTLDFGTGMPLVSAGEYDAFMAKLDTDGNPLWSMRFGGTGTDRIESVALTSAGDPVVGGSYGAAFSIDATNFNYNGGTDGFVIKFSGVDGAFVWRNRFGDVQNQRCASVAIADASQDVHCFGDFSGTVTFASSMTSSGLQDLFLVRYSAAGTVLDAVRSGDSADQTARSIAVNEMGVTYASALFDGVINWGPMPVTSAGQGDVFLGKFQSDGSVPWTLRMGDSNTQRPNAVTRVAGIGIAVVGEFEGAADIGGKAVFSSGGYDAFIARVNAVGEVSWIRSVGDGDPMVPADDQFAADVAASDGGTVFVTGYVAGAVNFGNGMSTGPGDTDFFVMRLDLDGQTVWSLRAGSDNSQFGRAIALSGTNQLVVAGDFRNTLDLGNGPLTSAGSNDVFIAKLNR